MATELHQALAGYLYHAILKFVTKSDLGIVPFPPLRVRVPDGRYREPDVLFLRNENFRLRSNRIWKGADLVMEVVSGDPKDRQRDNEDKFRDYSKTGIGEYWFVDSDRRIVIVHRLDRGQYVVHGEYSSGQHAESAPLLGFSIDVAALFAVAEDIPD